MTPEERDAIYQHNADDPLMIIHDNDFDGFGAAMVAVQVLGQDAVELVPARNGDDLPGDDLVVNRNVRMFDITYKRELMIIMADLSKSLLVFDHHETAEMEYRGLDFCRFEMDKSAVRMAWEYFHPEGAAPPEWVRLIEDRDLWRFRYGARTRNFRAYMQTWPRTVDGWLAAFRHPAEEQQMMGAGVLAYQTRLVDSIARHATRLDWSGFGAVVVNTGTMCSDVGNRMLQLDEGAAIAICYYQTKDGLWHHELRTRTNTGPHVGHLARAFGGGGHPNAAGFEHAEMLPTLPEGENGAAAAEEK